MVARNGFTCIHTVCQLLLLSYSHQCRHGTLLPLSCYDMHVDIYYEFSSLCDNVGTVTPFPTHSYVIFHIDNVGTVTSFPTHSYVIFHIDNVGTVTSFPTHSYVIFHIDNVGTVTSFPTHI